MAQNETVHVGLCEIRLRLHGIDSLKGKRGIAKSLIARIHNKFNVSIAECRYLDSKQYLGLAMSAVSNSRRIVDSEFNKILAILASDPRLELESHDQLYV